MAVRTLRGLLQQLRAEGHCILFSSHVMQEIAALCDEVVVIAHGRVVAQGTPAELLIRAGTESLEEAFVRLVGRGRRRPGARGSRPMRAIWRVFIKEVRENLRDRRTVISALIFGPCLVPFWSRARSH